MRLTEAKILGWADAHRARTGKWPTVWAGRVYGASGKDWSALDGCLEFGGFGLPGGSSLARLLAKHRGVGRRYIKPRLTIKQVLTWADAHHKRTGEWPTKRSDAIRGARSETWKGVDTALRVNGRGFLNQGSLARLLAKHRGTLHPDQRRRFTITEILSWADAHRAHHGDWPVAHSGPIAGVPGETWRKVDKAIGGGMRGLAKNGSLAKLLAERRGKRHRQQLSKLAVKQILGWADAHHKRTGSWPNVRSGPIPGVAGETWGRVHGVLFRGGRGLPEGGSLTKLLAKHRGVRNRMGMPDLKLGKILEWADAHHERTGTWPTKTSGAVHGQEHETWGAIDSVMEVGGRGLRQRGSLPQLLERHRNVLRGRSLPRLSVSRILEWADAHFEREGEWPSHRSGLVPEAPDEVWSTLDKLLRNGGRGLPGASSVSDILRDYRDVTRRGKRSHLTTERILLWAHAHYARTYTWPKQASGRVHGTRGEKWSNIDQSLRLGLRGLRGGTTLYRLLVKHFHIDCKGYLTVKKILAWADEHHARTGAWPEGFRGVRGTHT